MKVLFIMASFFHVSAWANQSFMETVLICGEAVDAKIINGPAEDANLEEVIADFKKTKDVALVRVCPWVDVTLAPGEQQVIAVMAIGKNKEVISVMTYPSLNILGLAK